MVMKLQNISFENDSFLKPSHSLLKLQIAHMRGVERNAQHPQVLTGERGGNPEKAGIPPRLKEDGHLPETALCVSGRYPKKADKGREEGCSFSPRISASQER